MRTKRDMIIKNHYFSVKEIELLENKAKKLGISVSEVLRRIIDSYFDKENETIDALVDLHRKEAETKATTNEKFTIGISFGLNDRIGFEKHLFAGSSDDMNRVVSQLGTFDSFEEVQNFIEDMVKPDYDNWEGKEDYVQRFMDIVEKKFA